MDPFLPFLRAALSRLADRVRRARVDLRVVLTPSGWTRGLAPLASRLVTLPPLAPAHAPARRSA